MNDFSDPPWDAADRFTPELMELVGDPLYSAVWADERLSPRDRSIATLAALTVLYRPDELPAHLRLGINNGVNRRRDIGPDHARLVLRRLSGRHLGLQNRRRNTSVRPRIACAPVRVQLGSRGERPAAR